MKGVTDHFDFTLGVKKKMLSALCMQVGRCLSLQPAVAAADSTQEDKDTVAIPGCKWQKKCRQSSIPRTEVDLRIRQKISKAATRRV